MALLVAKVLGMPRRFPRAAMTFVGISHQLTNARFNASSHDQRFTADQRHELIRSATTARTSPGQQRVDRWLYPIGEPSGEGEPIRAVAR
jgi:hypothetical protein